nr:ribonuclease H-like domain-containing protein [Tanacetum cinerariifolium]
PSNSPFFLLFVDGIDLKWFSDKIEMLAEIILFSIDFGRSKHITRNLKLLSNLMEKFLGTVKFENDQIAPVLSYGDLVQGNVTINRVYYVGGFSWHISLFHHSSRHIYKQSNFLIAKASSSQAWLWHRHLLHLNFDTINLLSKYDIVTGLPILKFVKDHLCSSYELGKAKCKSFKTKTASSSKIQLQILCMDLCGPMRVESINGKKYVLVIIIDDYLRYTWTYFLRSKDETPKVLINFHKIVQRGLHAQVRTVQTEKGIDDENLDKVKEKGDACIYVGYSTQSRACMPSCVKSSHVHAADAPDQRQHNTTPSTSPTVTADTPSLNTQTTSETTCQAPTQAPIVTATENINQAETQKKMHKLTKTNLSTSSVHRTPLDKRSSVRNPSQSIRTSRQLEKDGEMCMFLLIRKCTSISQTNLLIQIILTKFTVSKRHCMDSSKLQERGGDKLVSRSLKKQDYTLMSSVEAEYVSLSACYAQVLLRTQLTYYGFYFDKIPMYCDSQAAIAISCNPVHHSRTKHIDVKYHFIKEQVEKGIVELLFFGTEYQLADLFTKALPKERFKYLVRRLGMRRLTPDELDVLANESA